MPSTPHVDIDAATAPAFGLADELEAGIDGDWHTHRKHQLLYADAGALQLILDDGQWLLPPQRVALLGARTRHRVRTRGRVALRTLYLAPRFVAAPVGSCRVFAVTPLLREMLLYGMRFAPTGPRPALATPFFATLAALLPEWTRDELPLRLPAAHTPELDRAMAYALAHLDDPDLAAAAAARAGGLSSRTLARRFTDEARTSWRDFVGAARMLRAMELLALPGARVTQTAYDVGFTSLGAFTRAFHAFAGELPRDYAHRVDAAGK